ncbi:RCC1 domain-containing protein 1 [Phlyctochytrium planicorne]|nr:RCC1 domain-containing protein 1 [Phlyctochytrium planicorne]
MHHSIAVVESRSGNGDVYAWGSNFFGQTGQVSDERALSFSAFSSDDEDIDILEKPTLVDFGVETEINFVKAACGNFSTFALTDSGDVWAWGGGALGMGEEFYDSKPAKVEFFEQIGRRVQDIKTSASLTLALARPQDRDSSEPEIFLWGYLGATRDTYRKFQEPVIVSAALNLKKIESLSVDLNSLAVVSTNPNIDSARIDVFGYPRLESKGEVQGSPFFLDIAASKGVFNDEPTTTVHIDTIPAKSVIKTMLLEDSLETQDHFALILNQIGHALLVNKTGKIKRVLAWIPFISDLHFAQSTILILDGGGNVITLDAPNALEGLLNAKSGRTVLSGCFTLSTKWDHFVAHARE